MHVTPKHQPINRVTFNLVGGWPTILKNDGVRQWEGWHPIYWLVVYLPLWKILVSWDYYSQYMEKCSKPPTSNGSRGGWSESIGNSRPRSPGYRTTIRCPWSESLPCTRAVTGWFVRVVFKQNKKLHSTCSFCCKKTTKCILCISRCDCPTMEPFFLFFRGIPKFDILSVLSKTEFHIQFMEILRGFKTPWHHHVWTHSKMSKFFGEIDHFKTPKMDFTHWRIYNINSFWYVYQRVYPIKPL